MATFKASNGTITTNKGDTLYVANTNATITLENNTMVNNDKTAKDISFTLDKSSKIKLTGDSYITSFDNEDSSNSNIDFNGYKLYVNGVAIN